MNEENNKKEEKISYTPIKTDYSDEEIGNLSDDWDELISKTKEFYENSVKLGTTGFSGSPGHSGTPSKPSKTSSNGGIQSGHISSNFNENKIYNIGDSDIITFGDTTNQSNIKLGSTILSETKIDPSSFDELTKNDLHSHFTNKKEVETIRTGRGRDSSKQRELKTNKGVYQQIENEYKPILDSLDRVKEKQKEIIQEEMGIKAIKLTPIQKFPTEKLKEEKKSAKKKEEIKIDPNEELIINIEELADELAEQTLKNRDNMLDYNDLLEKYKKLILKHERRRKN